MIRCRKFWKGRSWCRTFYIWLRNPCFFCELQWTIASRTVDPTRLCIYIDGNNSKVFSPYKKTNRIMTTF